VKPGAKDTLTRLWEQVKEEVGIRTDIDLDKHISPRALKWIAGLAVFVLFAAGIFLYRYDNKKTIFVNFVDYGTYLRQQTDRIPPAKDWGLPDWSDTPEK